HPGDHRFLEHAARVRKRLHRRSENTVELEEGFLEEHNHVHVLTLDAASTQTEVDGAGREVVVMLLTAEALFLGGRHEDPVLEECRAGVMEEAGNAEDIHQNCLLAPSGMSLSGVARGNQPFGASSRSCSGSDVSRIPSANGPRTT